MKIGIVGGGAIGLLFAYYMQRAARTVTIYTRTAEQAEQIRRQGVTCIKGGVRDTVFPRAAVLAAEQLQDDYLFLAVKQYDIAAVVDQLHLFAGKLIFLQNGMSHIPLLQKLSVPAAVGIVEHGARKENGTTVHHTGVGVTRLGLVSGREVSFQYLLPLFQNPAFLLIQEQNWRQVLQHKLIVNACINPLTALYGVKNGELLYNPQLSQAMRLLFNEVLQVLGGGDEEARWQHVCRVCEQTAANTSSMLADLQAGRPTEVEAILGYLLQEARTAGMAVPLISFVYHSVKGREG